MNQLKQFQEVVLKHSGLVIQEHDTQPFWKIITARTDFLCLDSSAAYLQLLNSETIESQLEWSWLTTQLTVGETFFFRDSGQQELLRETILPELLEKRRAERQLRIWSAGCATGEEPYSLAILLDELIPGWEEWNIQILGTDLNEESLQTARKGLYSNWSFRITDQEVREKYFRKTGSGWLLDERIREKVSFKKNNLMTGPFPGMDGELQHMDLIVCRNVFIYFDRNGISEVVRKFAKTLNIGGYLLTGHGEIQEQKPADLILRVFNKSIIYQRVMDAEFSTSASKMFSTEKVDSLAYLIGIHGATPRPRPEAHTKSRPALPARLEDPGVRLKRVMALFDSGDYQAVIHEGESILKDNPHNFEVVLLMAWTHANKGDGKKAESFCQKALQLDEFSARPHFLLAHIAQDRGERDLAKIHLKKACYLELAYVPPYIELGDILQQDGDDKRARKMRSTALDILQSMLPSQRVEKLETWTAGDLVKHMEGLLKGK